MTDREIVVALAEKAMGWKARAVALTTGIFDDPDGGTLHWPNTFNPLESIADAWMVVEKMRDDGWKYHLADSFPSGRHFCRFVKLNDQHRPAYIYNPITNELADISTDVRVFIGGHEADSAPRAICLAALKAVQG